MAKPENNAGPTPPRGWRDRLELLVGSGLGSGFLPLMPGTWGTVPPLLATLALMRAGGWSLFVGAALAVGSGAATVFLGSRAEQKGGGKDPSWFVLDEWSGYFLTMALAWAGPFSWASSGASPGKTALASFALFRVADILKPFPARRLERLPGGWGILLDDLAAAGWAVAGLGILGRTRSW